MARKIITLWVDEGLLEAIDRLTEEMGYANPNGSPNRSAAIRHVLERATGEEATSSVLAEEVRSMHRRLREKAGPIAARVRQVILEELDLT